MSFYNKKSPFYGLYNFYTSFINNINHIVNNLYFRLITMGLISFGLYYQLYGYRDKYYGVDQLKYILILDKNATLINMSCRETAKYTFDIKTKPISQNEFVKLFVDNGWHKNEKYSYLNLYKNNVKILMTADEEYKTDTHIRLDWQ